MIICFNGVDGTGKSLQAGRLVDRLNAAGYPAVYVWTGGRRTFRRPLIWLGKKLLKRLRPKPSASGASKDKTQYQEYLSSTQRVFKYGWLRNLWLHMSLAEHAFEIWLAALPHLLRGRIVVCDRYLHDSIVRLAVLSGLNVEAFVRLLRFLAIYPVPRLTKTFFFDVPAEVAFSRKDDIPDLHFLERRIPLYRALAAKRGMQVVDGTASIDEITEVVWQNVQLLIAEKPKTALAQE